MRARPLDRYGRRRKNDKRDSLQVDLDVAHHLAGRAGLFFLVRLPTPAEELQRLPAREREALSGVRHQLLRFARGRALAEDLVGTTAKADRFRSSREERLTRRSVRAMSELSPMIIGYDVGSRHAPHLSVGDGRDERGAGQRGESDHPVTA